MVSSNLYQVGGTLDPQSQLYISRQADHQLLESCRQRHFAYILAPRQIGKSSLMVRTAARLADEGTKSVKLDLAAIGTQGSAESWYYGLLYEIRGQLGLKFKLKEWWRSNQELNFTQRLTVFFEEILLEEVAEPVVIFVDEIDTTLSLTYTDDFFALIRSLYVARASRPELSRLCFVLIGVATPGDLIRDPRRTPFNIGQRIEMTDFSFEEALSLADRLELPSEEARFTLGQVLEWTGGHPYLTQCLCQAITQAVSEGRWVNNPSQAQTKLEVDRLVTATFLGEKSDQDNNLQFVRDMLLRRVPDVTQALTLYRQIRRGRPAVVDEEQSLIKSHLKLSGVVKREHGLLRVRNQIYYSVFNEEWIKTQLPINWAKRLRQAQRGLALSLVVSLVLALLAFYALTQQNLANERAGEANAARIQAEHQQQIAQMQALAFRAQTVPDPQLRLLLALEAARRQEQNRLEDEGEEVETIFRQALQTFTSNQVLRGHTDQIYNASFSPDGKLVATAGWDNQAKIWDVRSGKELFSLTNHTNRLSGAAFSPDGKQLVTTSLDGTARVWDTSNGKELFVRDNWCGCPWLSPHFSPDGQRLLLASIDNLALLVDAHTGQELGVLLGHQASLTGASYSPDGKLILTTAIDGSAYLWDAASYQLRAKLVGQTSPVKGHFSPDSREIVTWSEDGTAWLWESQTGGLINVLIGHAGAVNSAVFTPDGTSVITVGEDGTARVWDSQSGKAKQALRGHNGAVLEVVSTPDGREVVTAGVDGTLRVWSLTTGRELVTLYGHSGAVAGAGQQQGLAFSLDGKWLLSAGEDGTARLWDWASVVQARVSLLAGHSADVDSAAFSPDGKYLVSASDDKTVRLWEASSGKELAQLPQQNRPVNSAAFSPDGRYLLTSGEDSTVRLWESASGWQQSKVLNAKNNSGNPVRGALFSADGRLIAASIPGDGKTLVWSLNQLEAEPSSFPGVMGWGRVGQLFSPDNKRIVTLSLGGENEAWVWELTSGKKLMSLQGHTALLNSASFSRDGRYLVTASQDGTLRVWDSSTGQDLKTLRGHAGGVNSAVFSPDDRFIVSAGKDETVRVWETNSGKEIASWHSHAGLVYTASFSLDGKRIVSASADKTVQVFSCQLCGTLSEIVQLGQNQVGRSLTEQERRQFGL
jgi:WD40 repeat protein